MFLICVTDLTLAVVTFKGTLGRTYHDIVSSEPSLKYILFSCSVYLHLFEIAIYLWLGSIGDTKGFQFVFRSKITWNYVFEETNYRRMILIFSLLAERQ